MKYLTKLNFLAKHIFKLKVVIHLACLLPLIVTYYKAFNDRLGADPVEAILHFTGISAFNLILISLLISPMAREFKLGFLIHLRRLIGLYAFTYGCFHFVSYVMFELQYEWILLGEEIIKRPYITVGFSALLILLALAITSPMAIRKAMGRKWQSLHNSIYLCSLLVLLHYVWSVKSDLVQPTIYGTMLLFLLYFRLNRIKSMFKLKKK